MFTNFFKNFRVGLGPAVPGGFVGPRLGVDVIELEDEMLDAAGVARRDADEVNGRARPAAHQFLKRFDLDIVPVLRQAQNALIVVGKIVEFDCKIRHRAVLPLNQSTAALL